MLETSKAVFLSYTSQDAEAARRRLPPRARQKLDDIHALEAQGYVDLVTFADVHANLGEFDEALRWFEKAFQERTPNMVNARGFGRNCPEIASNLRYQAIVARMNFPSLAM
jgi:tetratricopeptide (TPR) repeat protein